MAYLKKTQDPLAWNTPRWLFDFLNAEYSYTLDAAASETNAKCKAFFTKDDSALTRPWLGRVFCNPPYGDRKGAPTADWVKHGFVQATNNAKLVTMLIPLKTDTDIYHDYIRMGELMEESRFADPRGKAGIFQKRRASMKMMVETFEFRQRIQFEDDQGRASGSGWFATVALTFINR